MLTMVIFVNKARQKGVIKMAAQANSSQLVTVAGKTIEKIEYNGVPVVTLGMVDDLHTKSEGQSRVQFNKNKNRFNIGKDFFVANSNEAREMGFVAPNGLTLLAERGYLKLVKTFTDDLSWEVQDQLVDCYFRVKQQVALPDDPILAQLQIMMSMRQDVLAIGIQQQVLATGIAETRQEFNKFKEEQKLANWQQNNLQKAVNHKVELWREMYPSLNTRKAYPAIYRHLKDKFQVPRYNEIPAIKYDQALNTVNKLNLSNLAGL